MSNMEYRVTEKLGKDLKEGDEVWIHRANETGKWISIDKGDYLKIISGHSGENFLWQVQYVINNFLSPNIKIKQSKTNKIMETQTVKFPDIEVELSGSDGNAFMIMGKVANALKKGGATKEQVEEYYKESQSGDYDNLLRVAMKWVSVS